MGDDQDRFASGVLHVRPAIDMKDPEQEKLVREITDEVAELATRFGGLLWGEHGKGVRSEYGPRYFGPLYPALQLVKAAFDPHNQLNPGKIAAPSGEELLRIDGVPTVARAIGKYRSLHEKSSMRPCTATETGCATNSTLTIRCALRARRRAIGAIPPRGGHLSFANG